MSGKERKVTRRSILGFMGALAFAPVEAACSNLMRVEPGSSDIPRRAFEDPVQSVIEKFKGIDPVSIELLRTDETPRPGNTATIKQVGAESEIIILTDSVIPIFGDWRAAVVIGGKVRIAVKDVQVRRAEVFVKRSSLVSSQLEKSAVKIMAEGGLKIDFQPEMPDIRIFLIRSGFESGGTPVETEGNTGMVFELKLRTPRSQVS